MLVYKKIRLKTKYLALKYCININSMLELTFTLEYWRLNLNFCFHTINV